MLSRRTTTRSNCDYSVLRISSPELMRLRLLTCNRFALSRAILAGQGVNSVTSETILAEGDEVLECGTVVCAQVLVAAAAPISFRGTSLPHNAPHHRVSRCHGRVRKADAAMIVAAFFHDAICDSQSKENEVRSAKLAREFVSEAGLSSEFGGEISALVMATQKHLLVDGVDLRSKSFSLTVTCSFLPRHRGVIALTCATSARSTSTSATKNIETVA